MSIEERIKRRREQLRRPPFPQAWGGGFIAPPIIPPTPTPMEEDMTLLVYGLYYKGESPILEPVFLTHDWTLSISQYDYSLESANSIPAPRNGTLRRMFVNVYSSNDIASATFTVRLGGIDTALSVSISPVSKGVFSKDATIEVGAGKLISVKADITFVEKASNPNLGVIVSFEYIPNP